MTASAQDPFFPETPATPLLIVVSGPAGSGKTTLCDRLLGEFGSRIQRAITSTTRAPRTGERPGVDYHFQTREAFEQGLAAGDYFESAEVHGNRYGTLRSEITGRMTRGVDVLLNIDVQGAAAWRQLVAAEARFPGRLVTVFVCPPSLGELRDRLVGRGLDPEAVIDKRLRNALEEVRHWPRYDYVIRSADRERDYDRMRAIYLAEKLRNAPGGTR